MKSAEHKVIIKFGNDQLPRQGAAKRIFAVIDIVALKFVERYGANSSYDFYWMAKSNGVEYQIHGDRWETDEPQAKLTVTVIGRAAYAMGNRLTDKATESGWNAQFIEKGTKLGKHWAQIFPPP